MIDMDKRLLDMPVMAQRDDEIEARLYNLWRRVRMRRDAPLRLELDGLKEMQMVLTDRYWACVNTVQYDAPVLAWVEFAADNRQALHTPIACKLNYYHFAASALRAKALAVMEQELAACLDGE